MRRGLIGEHLGHSYSQRIHETLGGYPYELDVYKRQAARTAKKQRRNRRMSEEKKTQVYLGVISLVQQGRSLNELKVSEIAEASGIGKGTCYEYFSSKEEIIRETLLYTFHKEFDNFCGLLQFEQGFEAGFRQILTVMEKALRCV